VQYHATTIPFTTTASPPQPNEYHPPPRCCYRCGGLKPLHLPHSSWRYFRRKLRSWAPNRSPATVCSGQILCLPFYLSIFIVTLTYIHTYTPPKVFRALLSISLNGPKIMYIHTYPQAFIHAFFAGANSHHGRRVSFAASYRGGRPCPRRHITINGRVSILDAMYVCMGGLSCLFAAESNGIVQSLLRSMGGAQQEVFKFLYTS
jgi:hypothetical protein